MSWEAHNLGLPKWKLWRMAGTSRSNRDRRFRSSATLFDFLFRSNTRNLRIVRRHLDKHHPVIEHSESPTRIRLY
jgi:hypothetical protein